MTASQLSRLETNRAILESVLRNLLDLGKETADPEPVNWSAAQIRRACERLDEIK
jgi:hypothetical protein